MNPYGYVQEKLYKQIIYYVIDWKYRKSVHLCRWLKKQVDNPAQNVLDFAATIKNNSDYDKQMRAIFLKVMGTYVWVSDQEKWGMPEHWNTAEESVELGEIDCEDGAILMYVLGRIKGIPAYRMFIDAGDVDSKLNPPTEGHCWLTYKGNKDYYSYFFLDWCYWKDTSIFSRRNMFSLYGKEVHEFRRVMTKKLKKGYKFAVKSSHYKNIWFGFNEDISFKQHRMRR